MNVKKVAIMNNLQEDEEVLCDITGDVSEQEESFVDDTNDASMSWYGAVFLVVNAALGAGLLDFPLSFHKSGGILLSVCVEVLLVLLITGSLMMYVYCTKLFKSQSYQEVVIALCGKKIGISCGILVVVYSFITNVTFLLVICDQWEKFIELLNPDYIGNPPWYFDRRFFITVSSILLILPFSYSKRIDFLKYPSSLGVLVMIYLVFLVVVKYYTGVDGAKVGPIRTRPEHIYDLILDMPTICFGYQCHLNIVPIYQTTRNAAKGHTFTKTIVTSMLLCFAVYTFFAVFGYLTFGSCVRADILLCYVPTPEVLTAVIGMAIKMFVSYPLQLYVGRQVLEDLLMMLVAQKVNFEGTINTININSNTYETPSANNNTFETANNNENINHHDNNDDPLIDVDPNVPLPTTTTIITTTTVNGTNGRTLREKWELLVRGLVVTLWFVASLLISLFVSDIDRVIPLLGAMASLFIFVYPGVCMIRLLKTRPILLSHSVFRGFLMALSIVILLLGTFIFGVTITNLFMTNVPSSDIVCT